MQEGQKHLFLENSFPPDAEFVMQEYERALLGLNWDQLPLKISRAIKFKLRIENNIYRDGRAKFFAKALSTLGFNNNEATEQAKLIAYACAELLSTANSPEKLVSIILAIEENLEITFDLLKTSITDSLKQMNRASQYRNSSFKLFFDLAQNYSPLKELKEVETDDGLLKANECVTELTRKFFAWWKFYYTAEKIESSLL